MNITGSRILVELTDEQETMLRDPAEQRRWTSSIQSLDVNLLDHVLPFSARPPALQNRFSFQRGPGLFETSTTQRAIPIQPTRVIDAPRFEDNLCTNLMAWSRDNYLAVVLPDSSIYPEYTLYLLDTETNEAYSLGTRFSDKILCICFSPNSQEIALGFESGNCQIWNTSSGDLVHNIDSSHSIHSLAWTNNILTAGNKLGMIAFYDVRASILPVSEFHPHYGAICNLKVSCDGTKLASGGMDCYLRLFDIRNTSESEKYRFSSPVKGLAWCPWNRNLVAAAGSLGDNRIITFNTGLFDCVAKASTCSDITCLVWAPNHQELVSTHGNPRNSFCIWTGNLLAPVAEVTAHTARVLACDISPNGSTLCTISSDSCVKFWTPFSKSPNTIMSVPTANLNSTLLSRSTLR